MQESDDTLHGEAVIVDEARWTLTVIDPAGPPEKTVQVLAASPSAEGVPSAASKLKPRDSCFAEG